MAKETIKIQVRVLIEYDKETPNSRKFAIKQAKDNLLRVKTYRTITKAVPLTTKLIK